MEDTLPELKELIIASFALGDGYDVAALSCVSKYWSDSSEVYRRHYGIITVSGLLSGFPDQPLHGECEVLGTVQVRDMRALHILQNYRSLNDLHLNPAGENRYVFHFVNGFLIEAYFLVSIKTGWARERYLYCRKIDKMIYFRRENEGVSARACCLTDEGYHYHVQYTCKFSKSGSYIASVYLRVGTLIRKATIEETPLYPVAEELKPYIEDLNFKFKLDKR